MATYIRALMNETEMERKKAEEYAASLEEKVAERTKELSEISQVDELTGLYNVRALRGLLRREIVRSKRLGIPLTLAYLDIDKFKNINDTMGHKKGDEVLIGLAKSVNKLIREDDFACRCGGDEFCIILPNADAVQAERVCRRFFDDFSKKFKKITLSVGIAQADLDRLDVPDTLVKEADSLMYKSKKKAGFSITIGV
jgi:diguanylate cyclase (GGDEF)-like protein